MTSQALRPYKQQLLRELGREALYDDQISAVGRREFKRRWGGTFPSDGLPPVRPNRFYVVNSGFRGGPGAHWTGLYISPGGRAYIFDSFARMATKIVPATVRRLEREHFVIEDANSVPDQRGASEICGVLSFVMADVRSRSWHSTIPGWAARARSVIGALPLQPR